MNIANLVLLGHGPHGRIITDFLSEIDACIQKVEIILNK
jgi:hypothetical protein